MAKWHGGKGDKRRPEDKKKFDIGWDVIFGQAIPKIKVRKETPEHGKTQVHKDKTKSIPRKAKHKNDEEGS